MPSGLTISAIRTLHRAYKVLVSPFLGERCRFEPCCSDYALKATESHGLCVGMFLAIKRIVRCHPLCVGGFDPVPLPKVSLPKSKQ